MDGDVKKVRQLGPTTPKYYIPEGLDGAELIPIDLGGRLMPPSISINELGKQLLKASIEGNAEDIKVLMNKGAPFTADWLGTSPLHFAAQNNHLEVCEILLRAGISKDARTKVDRTPLHIAAYEGHLEIVKCLLRNKADIDCKDLLGMTPLHWAVQNSHAEIVSLLVRKGAQPDIVNKFSLTPLDIAAQCNRPDVIEILNTTEHEPDIVSQNLTIQMNEIDNSSDSIIYPSVETLHAEPESPVPIETVFLEDIDSENSIDPERLHINQDDLTNSNDTTEIELKNEPLYENEGQKFTESIKLLQQHGITMLPADDTNILSSIIETGHSVVLTEAGKQVLNSIRPVETIPSTTITKVAMPKFKTVSGPVKSKKIITVTPQEFLAMTLNQEDVLKQIGRKFVTGSKPTVKRIVMKKNKVVPITASSNVVKVHKPENIDIDALMKQLIEANKRAEEYRQKLLKKEAEAEGYKQQLLLIAQSKNYR